MRSVPAEETSALTLTLVAGGFTTLGVLLKIAYDSLAARRDRRTRGLERFAEERRAAYDQFLGAVKAQRGYDQALWDLAGRARAGETEMPDDEREAFPASAFPELVEALERVRRLARGYTVISSAEAIVRLFGDATGAVRAAVEDPGPNDDITWFVLQRLLDDRVGEFLHGYREDLGIGSPSGGPKRWPIVDRERPVSVEESERIVRAHITKQTKPGKPD